MELFSELYFGDVLIFTENDLYFIDAVGYLNEEESYLEYFNFEFDNLKRGFAFNFISFLSQAWRDTSVFPYKTSFTKENILDLVGNSDSEKLKFFLYESCKDYLKYYFKTDKHSVQFCKDILSYYKSNPINEKLVNMELKLRK